MTLINLSRRHLGRLLALVLAGMLYVSALPAPIVTAQAQTFSISGRVDDTGLGTGTPIPDVTMTLRNSQTDATLATQLTDAGGNYSFTGLTAGGSYEVAPSKAGFTFNPTTRGFPDLAQSWVSQHFKGTQGSTSSTVQFSVGSASVTESADAKVEVTVTRTGDVAQAASVDYATSNVTASDRSDYLAAYGTLRWGANDGASKTVTLFIVDDAYGNTTTNGQSDAALETFNLTLSNAVGCTTGSPDLFQVSISNDETADGANPVKAASFVPQFFVRQHYLDFFNREPDPGGLAFWMNQTTNCGAADLQVCRNNVSAAFFVSGEFQETGYFVFKMYQAAYGASPGQTARVTLREFLPDLQQVGRGVVFGQSGAAALLESNKQAYAARFTARARFAQLAALPNSQFVETLNQNTEFSLTQAQIDSLVSRLNSGQMTRAQALREVAENPVVSQRFFTRAFVLMQYYGYLRRNPFDAPEATLDYAGYNFWLGKLNQFGGNYITSQMVQAFITSGEYERRFGP